MSDTRFYISVFFCPGVAGRRRGVATPQSGRNTQTTTPPTASATPVVSVANSDRVYQTAQYAHRGVDDEKPLTHRITGLLQEDGWWVNHEGWADLVS